MADKTKDWELYEAGKRYNNRLTPNYYDTVDANIAFFNGDQWRNLPDNDMPKPVMNIIKRVITFFVASLTSSNAKIHFEPMLYAPDAPDETMKHEKNASEIANAQVKFLMEKFKMEFRVKDALYDGANTGDYCAHFYFDPTLKPFGGQYSDIRGEIVMELVDGGNVFFGNANNPRVDVQPYIGIAGRDMVKNLQDEAERHKAKKEDIDAIKSDTDYGGQVGDAGKIEVEADEYGKALYIIVYRKVKKTREVEDENGKKTKEEYTVITASKCVENAYIFKDVETGLETYPVAWGNWEKQKNQYHGRALATGLLPNQIFINRMFAMVMYHLMLTAFPKGVYNADLIDEWNNEIGAAIGVKGVGPQDNIKNIAGYLEPGNMSAQIVQVIDLAMQYTKETLGVSDAALGQIDPKNTSATIAVQKSSAIPLGNPRANLYEWIEDIGRILLDMMGTYYGPRPIMIEREGKKVLETFDFGLLKDMWLNVNANVGEASYWSEIAAVQTLDALLQGGYIDIVQYLERVPDEYVPQKQELISQIQERMQAQQQPLNPGNDIEAIIAQLSPEEQAAFWNATPEEQQQLLSQIAAG